jgi:hypothetical protein
VCTYAYINNKFVQDPDPESDPDPDPDTDPESDPKLFEKSDPDPDTDPKKIIPDPQHWIKSGSNPDPKHCCLPVPYSTARSMIFCLILSVIGFFSAPTR